MLALECQSVVMSSTLVRIITLMFLLYSFDHYHCRRLCPVIIFRVCCLQCFDSVGCLSGARYRLFAYGPSGCRGKEAVKRV